MSGPRGKEVRFINRDTETDLERAILDLMKDQRWRLVSVYRRVGVGTPVVVGYTAWLEFEP